MGSNTKCNTGKRLMKHLRTASECQLFLESAILHFLFLMVWASLVFYYPSFAAATDIYPVDLSKGKYDISKSWVNSHIYIPDHFFKKNPKEVELISVSPPKPVVVYMHGAGGIGSHDTGWANFLRRNGYVVVMPDSFAIPNRVLNVDSKNKIANLRLVPVNLLRPTEAEYAISQLKLLNWVDINNIFLMGHSEGANASTYINDVGYKGLIISSNLCHFGFRVQQDIPILAISYEKDTYLPNPLNWHCKDRWDTHYPSDSQNTESKKIFRPARKNTSQIILSGEGHATQGNLIAEQAVLNFLRRNTD
jgi:dienelactone hydrolase